MCKFVTKKGKKCSRNGIYNGYCQQHSKMTKLIEYPIEKVTQSSKCAESVVINSNNDIACEVDKAENLSETKDQKNEESGQQLKTTNLYCLSVTYENQNYYSTIVCCGDNLYEIELAKLRYFKNQLNCNTIDDMISSLETGYFIHLTKVTEEQFIKVKKYVEEYEEDGFGASLYDEFNEPFSEERQKLANELSEFLIEK